MRKSIRLQLLVTVIATLVAAGFFLIRGVPPRIPFHNAIFYDDAEQVRRWLRWGAKADIDNRDACRPLHMAAVSGCLKAGRVLLEAGANPNAVYDCSMCRYCETPLTMAAEAGHCDFVELLVSAGADVNFSCAGNGTALRVAVYEQKWNAAELLLSKGASVEAGRHGRTLLHEAAQAGELKQVEWLLAHKADPNADGQWGTPLHQAAVANEPATAAILIAAGAGLEARTQHGDTPLMLAAKRGHALVARVLIEKGADINAPDLTGLRPWQAAEQAGHRELARFLMRRGVTTP